MISETNTLKMGIETINSNHQVYVYNLKEYIGEEVTISFKAKADEGITTYLLNDKTGNFHDATEITRD